MNALKTRTPVASRAVGVAENIEQIMERIDRLSNAGAYQDLLCLVDLAITTHGDCPDLHAARGWALENLTPPCLDASREAYDTALALDPTQTWARLGLGTVLERLADPRAACQMYQAAIDLAVPQVACEPDLLELIGWCQYRLGRMDEAVETFLRALELDPAWVSVRFDLGLVLLLCCANGSATEEYELGLQRLRECDPDEWRGTVLVALDDLDEVLERSASLRESVAARSIRAQLASVVQREPLGRG